MNTSASRVLRSYFGPAYGHAIKRAWKGLNRHERAAARRRIEASSPPVYPRGCSADRAVTLLLAHDTGPARDAVIVLTAPLRAEPFVKRKDDEGKVIKGWRKEQRQKRRAWREPIAAARAALS